MKTAVFLGWLAELELTCTSGGHWLDELVADAVQASGSSDQRHEHWRVFAALAAKPLRAAEPALSPPS